MKFSETWLREWVDPDLSTQELAERLTMAGLEVDNISAAAPGFEGVVVGRVESVSAHPNADRLRVCQVACGESETVQVVCGASNVTEGMLSPFAKLKAELPGGFRIKKTRLRGVESFGMLCSTKELGLSDDASGLMVLQENAVPGTDIREYLQLQDTVIELDLTPNRGDCLSISGLAREISALTEAELMPVAKDPIAAIVKDHFPVNILAAEACPQYAGRVIKDIDPEAVTPLWMQERLRRCGIRSISPVVDITNYVMLELGQPMHAFDLAKLDKGIQVRFAQQGESLKLLDGRTLSMDEQTLVIADAEHALALAGIMGGERSAVGDSTRDIFLESAFFSPRFIAGKARSFGLHTDSSHRFERGVDPHLQVQAIERATTLILEIVGGEPGPVIAVSENAHLPKRSSIELRGARIRRLLGVSPSASRVDDMLRALHCQVEENQQGWRVTPPSFRFDLAIEADLIEEIARIYGYDHIPMTSQGHKATIQATDEAAVDISRIRTLLVDRGYQEAITFSFVDPAWEQSFNPNETAKKLSNPISSEMAVMRTSLWPGLIKAAQYNLNRQQTRIRLFETGLRFTDTEQGLNQVPMLACLVSGEHFPQQWAIESREADFFDLKNDVEALLELANMSKIAFRVQVHPALHPGQSAALYNAGRCCGWMGTLHPELEREYGLNQRVYLFEIELAQLSRRQIAHFGALSRFPAIRRDIAIVVDQNITAAQINESIRSLGVKALQECKIFDVYTGKGVSTDRKSIALGLILQDLSRTLTDLEVDDLVSRIVSRLERELGASLRE